MSEVTNFVKIVVARLKGDDAKVVALKNQRIAVAAVKGQISALESEQQYKEMNVDSTKESLEVAIFPDVLISSPEAYIQGVGAAQEKLDIAQSELDDVDEALKYYKELLAKVSA